MSSALSVANNAVSGIDRLAPGCCGCQRLLATAGWAGSCLVSRWCPDCFALRPGRWWAAGFRPVRFAGWLEVGWQTAAARRAVARFPGPRSPAGCRPGCLAADWQEAGSPKAGCRRARWWTAAAASCRRLGLDLGRSSTVPGCGPRPRVLRSSGCRSVRSPGSPGAAGTGSAPAWCAGRARHRGRRC